MEEIPLFHNPPEGDRGDVVLFRGNRDLEGFDRAYLCKGNSSRLLHQGMNSGRYTFTKEAPCGKRTRDITRKV